MAFPTDFDSMVSYTALLMQDLSPISPAVSVSQKADLLNSAMKAWGSEISPRIETISGLSVGADLSAAGTGRALLSVTTIAEILACYKSASALADIGVPMEKIELHEMIALQMSDQNQSATPTKWAVQQTSTTTAANVGKLTLWIHPLSDGTATVALAVRRNVPTISAAQVPNLSPEEIDYVCRIAAWDGARLAGRPPEFRDAIIAPLPEKAQVFMRKYKGLTSPTRRLEEEPV